MVIRARTLAIEDGCVTKELSLELFEAPIFAPSHSQRHEKNPLRPLREPPQNTYF
jgi:hypothetical protein